MGKGVLIQPSFYEAMKVLPDLERLALYDCICEYSLNSKEPEGLSAFANSLFALMKPNIDSANRRYAASVANGQKGGAPKGNQNARKKPKDNQKTTQKQPKNKQDYDLDSDYDLDNDCDKECDLESESAPAQFTFGTYNNVHLTEGQLAELKAEYPSKWEAMIENLSAKIAMKGYRYENHLAALRFWEQQDGEKDRQNARNKPLSHRFDMCDGITIDDYKNDIPLPL